MDLLNHTHLRSFWAVAREGSIAGGAKLLGLTQPTVSKQVGELEDAVGRQLFRRVGRRLVMSEVGRVVYAYADEIFALSRELGDALRGSASGKPMKLVVGVSDALPKLLTRRLLAPALSLEQPMRLVCIEGKTERLLGDLAVSGLDLVLCDTPPTPGGSIRVFAHELSSTPMSVYGSSLLAASARGGFPASLTYVPMLLPTENTALRRSIEEWSAARSIRMHAVAEFEDSGLLKAFGGGGMGCFFASTSLREEVERRYEVEWIGEVDEVREMVYGVTVERRVMHPGVNAVLEHAGAREDRSSPK